MSNDPVMQAIMAVIGGDSPRRTDGLLRPSAAREELLAKGWSEADADNALTCAHITGHSKDTDCMMEQMAKLADRNDDLGLAEALLVMHDKLTHAYRINTAMVEALGRHVVPFTIDERAVTVRRANHTDIIEKIKARRDLVASLH